MLSSQSSENEHWADPDAIEKNSQVIAEALDIEEIGEPFTDILTKHVVLQHPENWRRILAPILKHMF